MNSWIIREYYLKFTSTSRSFIPNLFVFLMFFNKYQNSAKTEREKNK